MELSALAGNAHVKAVLSQQEGPGPVPRLYPLRPGGVGAAYPGPAAVRGYAVC